MGEHATVPRERVSWIEAALPRVSTLARALAGSVSHLSRDELESAGREGLVEAAIRYDPASGVPFAAYAHYRIRGAMIDAARRAVPETRRRRRAMRVLEVTQALLEDAEKRHPDAPGQAVTSLRARMERAAELVTRTATAVVLAKLAPEDADAVADPDVPDAERAMLDQESKRRLHDAIAGFAAEDRDLIEAVYFEGLSMREYAQRVGRNVSSISRRHARVLDDLAARMREP